MDNRRALVAVSFMWAFSLAWSIWSKVKPAESTWHLAVAALYFVCNCGFIIVMQVLTLFRLHSNNTAVANMTAETNRVNPAANAANTATERQLTVATGYVVGVFGLSWIPLACTIIIIQITKMPMAIAHL